MEDPAVVLIRAAAGPILAARGKAVARVPDPIEVTRAARAVLARYWSPDLLADDDLVADWIRVVLADLEEVLEETLDDPAPPPRGWRSGVTGPDRAEQAQ